MSNNAFQLVTGEIVFSKDLDSFSGAKVIVYLEDVSFLDVPSRVVVKQVIPDISHQIETKNRVQFALKTENLNERANYSIRVHVSFHEDEQIHRGDYITMENYPVLTFGYPNHVSVPVQQVE